MHAFDFLCYIVSLNRDRVRAWRRHLVVGHALMDNTDQVWRISVIESAGKFSLCVGLDVRDFLHAGAELDEDDLVAGGGFVAGAVGYGAGDGGGPQRRQREQNYRREYGTTQYGPHLHLLPAFSRGAPRPDSRREISESTAAASSSREFFMF